LDSSYGSFAQGPLAILKDSWCEKESPISFGKDAREYLRGLHAQLEDAMAYIQVGFLVHDSLCSVNTCAVVYDSCVGCGDINIIPLSTELCDCSPLKVVVDVQ